MAGKFYGIGVGPGDPDLITMKAVKTLQKVSHIFAASSAKNTYSVALDIVKPYILPDTPVEYLPFPMTYNQERLESSWKQNSIKVCDVLSQGKDAAFVTLGDPLFYSTYIYLVREIQKIMPDVSIITIPGITSFQAAAAACNIPLVEGEESFAVASGAKGSYQLRKILSTCDNVVLLKVYRQIDDIIETLENESLAEGTCFVSKCGMDGETVITDVRKLKGTKPHYLSLMIIKKASDSGMNQDRNH